MPCLVFRYDYTFGSRIYVCVYVRAPYFCFVPFFSFDLPLLYFHGGLAHTRCKRRGQILKPLEYTRKLGSFHVRCTTKGGGQAGQAGAIRLGLARALEAHDPWLRKFLKKGTVTTVSSNTLIIQKKVRP